jgi:hypothetical protein
MRHVPITSDIFNAARNAEIAREAEFRAMLRRPDAQPLPDEPEAARRLSLGWLTMTSRRLIGRAAG